MAASLSLTQVIVKCFLMLVYSRETQIEPVTDLTLMFMVVPVSHGAALLCESVDAQRRHNHSLGVIL